MKKTGIRVALAAAILGAALAGCTQQAASSESAGAESAATAGSAAASSTASSATAASAAGFDEAQLAEHMTLLCRYVNQPATGADELQALDLFYYLVERAEENAQRAGTSYAAAGNAGSEHVIPLADLQAVAGQEFGFDYDFTPYTDGGYFAAAGRTADHYDAADKAFTVSFGTDYFPSSAETATGLDEIVSAKMGDDGLLAVRCRVSSAEEPGGAVIFRLVSYRFTVSQSGGREVYRLESVRVP